MVLLVQTHHRTATKPAADRGVRVGRGSQAEGSRWDGGGTGRGGHGQDGGTQRPVAVQRRCLCVPSAGSGPEQALSKCLSMSKLVMRNSATIFTAAQPNRPPFLSRASLTLHIRSVSSSKIYPASTHDPSSHNPDPSPLIHVSPWTSMVTPHSLFPSCSQRGPVNTQVREHPSSAQEPLMAPTYTEQNQSPLLWATGPAALSPP